MDFISYISPVIMRDMRDKLYSVGLILLLIGIVAVIPYLIKAFFWQEFKGINPPDTFFENL